MKKRISTLCIAAMLCTIVGCSQQDVGNSTEEETTPTEVTSVSEVETSDTTTVADTSAASTTTETSKAVITDEPIVSSEPPVQEIKINMDLLDEFGMTLSELEKKHGNVVSSEVADANLGARVMYYFEGNDRGYVFSVDNLDEQDTLRNGTPRIKDVDKWGERVEFRAFDGEVNDLFLGMESEMTVEEFEKIYEVKINQTHIDYGEGYTSWFWHENNERHYQISMNFVNDGIIKPNSMLRITYHPEGMW